MPNSSSFHLGSVPSEPAEMPPVAILCGGRGTRLQQRTPMTPKALFEIGGRPILWHVIQIYAGQGFTQFLLLTGYLSEAVRAFVNDTAWPAHVSVECLETGLDTPTGGRLQRALSTGALEQDDFCLTYADGVADLDLRALVAGHRASGLAATVTVVRPELQFGVAQLEDDGLVRGFVEKPRSEQWVNGGFFCLSPSVSEFLSDDTAFEREPLARLARAKQLRAFRHEGFWACMDTYKDALTLNDLWEQGNRTLEIVGMTATSPVTVRGARILVTGAYGLVGGWLTRALLAHGARVTVVKRDQTTASALTLMDLEAQVTVAQGDITADGFVSRVISEYEIDTVFHLAAQTLVATANRAPLATFETNIRGTWLLLEACRQLDVRRVVVAASDKAYGAHAELPYLETHALQPLYPYDVSKAATDMLARSYWHTYRLPVAVTRFANIYGGGDFNASRLIPESVGAALSGRAPVIRSDGSPQRDFLYVQDATDAYLAIAEALTDGGGGAGEAFNAGGGEPHRVLDVVMKICELAGTGVLPDVRGTGTPDGEIDRQWVDHTKLTDLTGWRPQVCLEQGLELTLDWYRRLSPTF